MSRPQENQDADQRSADLEQALQDRANSNLKHDRRRLADDQEVSDVNQKRLDRMQAERDIRQTELDAELGGSGDPSKGNAERRRRAAAERREAAERRGDEREKPTS